MAQRQPQPMTLEQQIDADPTNAMHWAGAKDREKMRERLEARLEGFCDLIQRAAALAGRK
jgi:hypothetical protein